MDPKLLQRRIEEIAPKHVETDLFGRINPTRAQIENVIHQTPMQLSKKAIKRLERQASKNPERW